jgi:stress response protein YsnF
LTVPVAAVRIVVRKRRVTTGTVRLRKTVREQIVNVNEPLVHQNVVVERCPIGRIVDTVAPPRREVTLW